MKKLKGWMITTMIFAAFAVAGMIICVFEPENIAIILINIYEDLTGNFGHTVEGLYQKLEVIVSVLFALLFITNQILTFCYAKKCKDNNKNLEEPKKTELKENTVVKKEKRKKKIQQVVEDTNKLANNITKTGKQISTF